MLLDTNVLIAAFSPDDHFHSWARQLIESFPEGQALAIDTIILAEVCVGDSSPNTVAQRIQSWGIELLDLPLAVAPVAATAYRLCRERRSQQSGEPGSRIPLPDFLIGAHASVRRIPLATADIGRYATYFPEVQLIVPPNLPH